MVTAVMILDETDSNLQKCAQNEILSGDWPGITSFGHLVQTA